MLYADDFIVGFEHRVDAERFLTELRTRVATYGLALHPDKTRLIEFGRDAAEHRRRRGEGKPETFNFLGFTHSCGKTRQGGFTVVWHTMRQRGQAKRQQVKAELQRRMHQSVPEQGTYLRSVILGHVRDDGVPMNTRAISAFRLAVGRLWRWALERRSQRTRVSWARMTRHLARWLPPARVCHSYPLARLGVVT
jgi:hypothetical protein